MARFVCRPGGFRKNGHTCLEALIKRTSRLWVFGYGSMLWKPGIEYRAIKTGYVRGFARRFWQGNNCHRGTAEKPGRVATLVPMKNEKVWGCAYLLEGQEMVHPALEHLGLRECVRGGYIAYMAQFYVRDDDRRSLAHCHTGHVPCHCHGGHVPCHCHAEHIPCHCHSGHVPCQDRCHLAHVHCHFGHVFDNTSHFNCQSGHAPDDSGPVHRQSGPVHCHSGPVHRHPGPVHRHSGPVHCHSGHAPDDSGPVHRHPGLVHRKSGHAPGDSGPVHRQSGPVHRHSGPVHRQTDPVHRESGPVHCYSGQSNSCTSRDNPSSRQTTRDSDGPARLYPNASDVTVRTFPVLLFFAEPENQQYLGDASVEAIARQIVDSRGQSGHNVEYVLKLADYVRDHIPEDTDSHLFSIEGAVHRLLRQRGLTPYGREPELKRIQESLSVDGPLRT